MPTIAEVAKPATPDKNKVEKSPAAAKTYDRKADDVGNILFVDHINLNIVDQREATVFYVMGLGLTRDPYMRVGIFNMGINVGRSQFHLPTAGRTDMPAAGAIACGGELSAQRLRGTLGLVILDLDALARRLEKVAPLLEGSQFSYNVHPDRVEATCPWGNRFHCHAPSPELGETDLAVSYIEFDVPRGAAAGIARFYREGLLASANVEKQSGDAVASVVAGVQKLLFRETDAAIPPYDGHHIAVYIANHSDPHRFLKEHNVDVEESNAHQYRFRDIIDPDSGKVLFTVEHEVRSMRHPLFDKPLVNRNPDQSNNYDGRGYDAFRGIY